jgi:hypothetical protein
VPSITAPIFHAGALKASLDASKIGKQVSIAQYEKAIQSAFADVADALAERDHLAERMTAQQALVAATQRAYTLADARYRSGVDGYLQVLDAQRALCGPARPDRPAGRGSRQPGHAVRSARRRCRRAAGRRQWGGCRTLTRMRHGCRRRAKRQAGASACHGGGGGIGFRHGRGALPPAVRDACVAQALAGDPACSDGRAAEQYRFEPESACRGAAVARQQRPVGHAGRERTRACGRAPATRLGLTLPTSDHVVNVEDRHAAAWVGVATGFLGRPRARQAPETRRCCVRHARARWSAADWMKSGGVAGDGAMQAGFRHGRGTIAVAASKVPTSPRGSSGHPAGASRALQVHQQQRDRRRGHAGDALGLADGLRRTRSSFCSASADSPRTRRSRSRRIAVASCRRWRSISSRWRSR